MPPMLVNRGARKHWARRLALGTISPRIYPWTSVTPTRRRSPISAAVPTATALSSTFGVASDPVDRHTTQKFVLPLPIPLPEFDLLRLVSMGIYAMLRTAPQYATGDAMANNASTEPKE